MILAAMEHEILTATHADRIAVAVGGPDAGGCLCGAVKGGA